VSCRARDGTDGPFLHSRDVFVLLSGLRRAGVFAGLDSEAESRFHATHPLSGAVGFSFTRKQRSGGSYQEKDIAMIKNVSESLSLFPVFRAPVAKWLTRRSAKPVYAGSIPARCSTRFDPGLFSGMHCRLFCRGDRGC
jgi:hypothetical protein